MNELVESAKQHRRRLTMGSLMRDQHEELSLFQDMQKQELSNFLHLSNEDVEASLRNETLKYGVPGKGSCDWLIAEPDKTDYDWLLTPPETPLFPSLDREVPVIIFPKQDASRSFSPHTSKSLGRQSSFSTRTPKGSPKMKRSSSFSISNNENRSIRAAPSKGALRIRSQPSTPTRSIHIRTGEGHFSHPVHQPVMSSIGTHSNSKLFSSARSSTSLYQVSPLKKPQPLHRDMELSFSSVPPPNLRTSLSDRNSSRSNTSHFGHKRHASVARISSHSTWMDSHSHLRWPIVSTSPISCSSSTSLERECLSSNSSKNSAISPYDEAFHGNTQPHSQPIMPDSPASFSSSTSSALQSSSRSNSVLSFAAHSERSENCVNESENTHGNYGIFRDMNNNVFAKQSKESGVGIKQKDDLQIENDNLQNHKENLSIQYTSEFDFLVSEDDHVAQNTSAGERVQQDHSLFFAKRSELALLEEEQLLTGKLMDSIAAEDNVSLAGICPIDILSLESEVSNRQIVPELSWSSEVDAQKQSVASDLLVDPKESRVLEKLEPHQTLTLHGLSLSSRDDIQNINAPSIQAFQNMSTDSREDNIQSEVLLESIKAGEQSLMSFEKQNPDIGGVTFGSDFQATGRKIIADEEAHSSATENIITGSQLSEKNIHNTLTNDDLDGCQQTGFISVISTDSSQASMQTLQSGNSHSWTCLEVKKDDLTCSWNCTDGEIESCCQEETFPIMDKDIATCSDVRSVSDVCEENEAILLDLQQVSSPKGATVNSDSALSGEDPSNLTVWGENVSTNTIIASADDKHDDQGQDDTGMQPLEPILHPFSSELHSHELSLPCMNALQLQSGDSTTDVVCTPSSTADTVVSAFSSSILQDRRFLETADAILFCSSIVHDIIYKASMIALEKEASNHVDVLTAANKALPLLFENPMKSTGAARDAAKSCRIQVAREEQITRQKLIYMQQQNTINSTVISHPENSAMQIDVKQQEEHVQAMLNSSKSREVTGNGKFKCSCTIL